MALLSSIAAWAAERLTLSFGVVAVELYVQPFRLPIVRPNIREELDGLTPSTFFIDDSSWKSIIFRVGIGCFEGLNLRDGEYCIESKV